MGYSLFFSVLFFILLSLIFFSVLFCSVLFFSFLSLFFSFLFFLFFPFLFFSFCLIFRRKIFHMEKHQCWDAVRQRCFCGNKTPRLSEKRRPGKQQQMLFIYRLHV